MSEGTQNEEVEFNQYIFSNNMTDPRLAMLLEMFYRGVLQNTVGIMLAKDVGNDGKDALLLVGVEANDDGTTSTYPLARILDPLEVGNYRSPDGKGGWFGEDA